MAVIYDAAIIGLGVAGIFAAHKMIDIEQNAKILAVELGRPFAKRRVQMCGTMGLLPSGDGKFYLTDTKKVSSITGETKAKNAYKAVSDIFKNVSDFVATKDKSPQISVEKRIKKHDFKLQLNDHIQVYPGEIHALSRFIAERVETHPNITFSFDNEVLGFTKTRNQFVIQTQDCEFKAKKVILATGRSGWRWAQNIFNQFNLIKDNQYARFGIRVEMPAASLKDFNRSNCTLLKEHLEVGPFCWNGTIIPEDHYDMAISSFRSNEARWKTDKVSFSYIREVPTENQGFEQTDRIGKLTFILTNDRIAKERVSSIINKRSKISILPDYDWLISDIQELSQVIPDLLTKAYSHIPTLTPLPPKIKLDKDLSTEVEGLYAAGENAGVVGLLAAAEMGVVVAESVFK
jgi:uncharacterized FAD-dependent dehydrogenase